jgi:hypothetical protein
VSGNSVRLVFHRKCDISADGTVKFCVWVHIWPPVVHVNLVPGLPISDPEWPEVHGQLLKHSRSDIGDYISSACPPPDRGRKWVVSWGCFPCLLDESQLILPHVAGSELSAVAWCYILCLLGESQLTLMLVSVLYLVPFTRPHVLVIFLPLTAWKYERLA